MFIFFCVFLFLLLTSMRFNIKGIDENYLSKDNTMAIKGIFIVFVFMSHIKGYTVFSGRGDWIPIAVISYLGQLMVAMFLFYSGYGIVESVKKKDHYIKMFPKNRLGKAYFDFAFAVLLFLFLDIIIGQKYSLRTTLLAFSGWTSIGNSNWYMFAVFTLYILTYLCFTLFPNSNYKAILLMTILSLIYIYIMSLVKEDWWSDTYLCFSAGMWYSCCKNHINTFFQKYRIIGWEVVTFFVFLMYIYLYQFRSTRLMMHNIVSVLFCVLIILLTMKISFKSRTLIWAGNNLFWLYILQRIPMIIFKLMGIAEWNSKVYLWLCLIITILLTIIISRCSNYLKRLLWWK